MPRVPNNDERFISIHVPANVHRELSSLARKDGRSLQKEVLHLIGIALATRFLGGVDNAFPEAREVSA